MGLDNVYHILEVFMAKVRVGINGFGRIGRMVMREGFDDLDIVGINCLMTPETTAHLLKWDSVHGKYKYDVEACEGGIIVNGKSIKLFSDRNPENIPWKDWGVDLVFECTGAFKKKEDIEKHMKAGAKKVMVSAPAPGADFTVVYGVNENEVDKENHNIISNASCTTNCLAPLVKVLNDKLGVEHGLMTTIHSYTNDQKILDGPHSDLRRARAAGENMIPTTTGAAKTVGKILPEMAGKIDGFAIRVPTPNVSLVDFTFTSKKSTSIAEVNQVLEDASKNQFKGIIEFEKEPLVSRDFGGRTASSMVDSQSTMVMGSNMVKVVSWYDNEAGFSKRMVDLAKYWLG
jgi:glyceraldehyde 3-phosphate dehydrogenase